MAVALEVHMVSVATLVARGGGERGAWWMSGCQNCFVVDLPQPETFFLNL